MFRGYNRSDGTTNERNLAGVRTVDEVLGRPANRPEMLPLEYYTESPTDAGNYATQDQIFFNDGLIPMARQEYNQLVMDGRTPAEDRDTWARRTAEDAYSRLTGRDRVTNGHVEEHTIYPRKTLDLSGVGEQASVDDIYRAISDQTGIPENTLDDALILMDIDGVETSEDSFDVFRVLRNEGTSGKVGSRLVQFLRDNGYDSVKYAESGTNHYAMLAEEPEAAPEEGQKNTPLEAEEETVPTTEEEELSLDDYLHTGGRRNIGKQKALDSGFDKRSAANSWGGRKPQYLPA